jgi:hypothetical protein
MRGLRGGLAGRALSARAVRLLGGAALAASATGAVRALTAIPLPVMLATGIALLMVASLDDRGSSDGARSRRGRMVWTAIGGLSAFALPTIAPPAPGHVVTRSAGPAMRGDLFDVLDALDRDPADVIGRVVSVSGDFAPAADGYLATVSRRIMSCCAADAVAVGFDVEMSRPRRIATGALVRVTGVVAARMRDGETRYVLERSAVAALDDSERGGP